MSLFTYNRVQRMTHDGGSAKRFHHDVERTKGLCFNLFLALDLLEKNNA